MVPRNYAYLLTGDGLISGKGINNKELKNARKRLKKAFKEHFKPK